MTAIREPVDVLLVSLGTTIGLRAADDQLAELLTELGHRVELVRPAAPPQVRTLALTDLVQARACAQAAAGALRRLEPRAIIYCSTTAALLWPRPGAIRFDALAQRTRPGHHGLWQRRWERRRLREATLLLPMAEASLEGAPAGLTARAEILPFAIDPPQHDARTHEAVSEILTPIRERGGRAVAISYVADPRKKGADRIVAAWAEAHREGEVLLLAGHERLPAEVSAVPGIVDVGRLPRAVFRALTRAVGVYVTAPRREDYGQVQLEALAEGARVVTTAAPGPYAALPLVRELWADQVVEDADADDPRALAAAMRAAIDARADPAEQLRATRAVAPWSRAAALEELRDRIVPRLLATAPAA